MKEFDGVRVRGRTLRYICNGVGSPTVVLEQGLGASMEAGFGGSFSMGWHKVFAEIQKSTRVFMYDRAGLGRSDPAPTPRSCVHMVKDLHDLLRAADIGPPYVFVGHSIGGFTARLYANEYSNEVTGMVLVDSAHPDQVARFAEVLPPPAPGEAPILKRLRSRSDPKASTEGFDFAASAAAVRKARSMGSKPLIVLSHSPMSVVYPGLSSELAASREKVWGELQTDLLKISCNGTRRVASVASHNIQIDEPQLVIDAILEVLAQARAPIQRVH